MASPSRAVTPSPVRPASCPRAVPPAEACCQQALLARRLVEAGSSFVTLDLSYHTASGTWDTHGIPGCVYGGITKGLGGLLPLFDHLLTTLVTDLEQRDMLEDTLVIAMGEFGRTPKINKNAGVTGIPGCVPLLAPCGEVPFPGPARSLCGNAIPNLLHDHENQTPFAPAR